MNSVSRKNRPRKFAFLFVCQQGELEIKSLMLAASLKRYLRCEYELIACVPEPREIWGVPGKQTLKLLEDLGVVIKTITNPIDASFPHANKISCFNLDVSADKLVFLDSDMLSTGTFEDDPRFSVDFNACIAPRQQHSMEQWATAYAACGVAMPQERTYSTVTHQVSPPHFNSGFVALNAGIDLAASWTECSRRLRLETSLSERRLWSDQLGLAVAIQKLGLKIDYLEETYNYPVKFRVLHKGVSPYFCHYHEPMFIRQEPALLELVHRLCAKYPSLTEMIRQSQDWSGLLPPYMVKNTPSWRKLFNYKTPQHADLILTGIPRSGTSYLCNLLHRYDNCVILNEPAGVRRALKATLVPWRLDVFYRNIRQRVRDGLPIENKIEDGELIEDTFYNRQRQEYIPEVKSADFVLGVKNNRGFLSRLPFVKQSMPQAKIVALMRDPFDTIASWKGSFTHLREAIVEGQRDMSIDDPFLSEPARAKLKEIAACTNLAERRAMLWRYLAEIIIENREHLLLVYYHDLILEPRPILHQILKGCNAGRLRKPVFGSQVRNKRQLLDKRDIEAISDICAEPARSLGLSLDRQLVNV